MGSTIFKFRPERLQDQHCLQWSLVFLWHPDAGLGLIFFQKYFLNSFTSLVVYGRLLLLAFQQENKGINFQVGVAVHVWNLKLSINVWILRGSDKQYLFSLQHEMVSENHLIDLYRLGFATEAEVDDPFLVAKHNDN